MPRHFDSACDTLSPQTSWPDDSGFQREQHSRAQHVSVRARTALSTAQHAQRAYTHLYHLHGPAAPTLHAFHCSRSGSGAGQPGLLTQDPIRYPASVPALACASRAPASTRFPCWPSAVANARCTRFLVLSTGFRWLPHSPLVAVRHARVGGLLQHILVFRFEPWPVLTLDRRTRCLGGTLLQVALLAIKTRFESSGWARTWTRTTRLRHASCLR